MKDNTTRWKKRERDGDGEYFKAQFKGKLKVVNESIVELWLRYISSEFNDARKLLLKPKSPTDLGRLVHVHIQKYGFLVVCLH